jgi:protein O-GlcNAc transferase
MQEPTTEIDANLASSSLLSQALAYHQSGRLMEAEQLYLQILQQQPTHLDALHNLGTIACQFQKFDRAINYFQQVLTHAPQRLDTHTNLAHALKAIGNLPEAIKHYEIVLEASPDLADIHFNLGQLLVTQKRLDEAIAHYQRTIDILPQNVQAYLSLSDLAISQQQLDIARSSLKKAIEIQPDCADAYWNLCALLRQTDNYLLWRQTAEKYVQFCELSDPIGSAIALIQAYYKTGMHSEALKKLEELELKIYCDIHNISEKDIGRIYFLILFAIVRLRDDLELNSKLAKLIGLLYAQNAQRTLAKLPNHLHRASSSDRRKSYAVANLDMQQKQLRLGFISSNFRRHPVSWCSADTIQALAKLTPHIYLYATSKLTQDDRTQVFEAIAYKCNWQGEPWQQQQESDTFNNLSNLITEIEQDDLDVLIDLDSLTASRHPEILIHKPARLCISWLGFDAPYLCSDNYNLGDRHTHPLGMNDYYIEKTLRLPDSHMAVAGFPSVKIDGKAQRKSLKLRIKDIIYLCVTPSVKLNRATVEAHIQIVKSVPNSILLYKGRGDLDIVKSLYDQACTAQSLDRKRIKFLPLTDTEEEHRSVYAVADVLLDHGSAMVRFASGYTQRRAKFCEDGVLISHDIRNYRRNCANLG